MELKDILSISGAPGLYKYVAQGKGGIIVESLGDSRRQLIGGSAKVSALGDIAIFTDADEVSLAQVFQNIYDAKSGAELTLSNKSDNATLSEFMAEILPNYDRERVHISDIKKLISWYNMLIKAGITKFISETDQTEATTEDNNQESEASTTEPAVKKSATKNAKPAADQNAKKQAVKNAKPKASTASQPKVVTPKTTTNRKSS